MSDIRTEFSNSEMTTARFLYTFKQMDDFVQCHFCITVYSMVGASNPEATKE